MTYEVGLVVVAREVGEVPGVVEPAEGEVPPGVVVGPVEGLVVSLEGGGVDPPVRQLLSAGGRFSIHGVQCRSDCTHGRSGW